MASGHHDSLSLLCFCTRYGRCDLSRKAMGILNWISTKIFQKCITATCIFLKKSERVTKSGQVQLHIIVFRKNIIITLTFLEQAIINFLTFKAL